MTTLEDVWIVSEKRSWDVSGGYGGVLPSENGRNVFCGVACGKFAVKFHNFLFMFGVCGVVDGNRFGE